MLRCCGGSDMARQRLFETPRISPLLAVLESIRDGELLFPDFQRPFVWSDQQRLALFDSVLSGMPIGSFLVWRTDLRLVTKRRLGPFELPARPDEPTGGSYNYVLDGLQRLSTLYAGLIAPRAGDDPEVAEGRWPVFFDLESDLDEGDESRFKLQRRRRVLPASWIPLSVLGHDEHLWERQSALFSDGREAEALKAKHLARRFAEYEVPLVPVVTRELAKATRTFERVNSQGTPMSEAHMLRALIYGDMEIDAQFRAIVDDLPWPSLDVKVFVNTLKAIKGADMYAGDLRGIADALRGEPGLLKQLRKGLSASVEFLCDHCGIHGERALPYAYQLVALARAAVRGIDLQSPDPRDTLTRWFWATTYGEMFTGASGPELRRAFDAVETIAQEPFRLVVRSERAAQDDGLAPTARTVAFELPAEPPKRFSARSVRSLAMMHRLAECTVVDIDGHPVEGRDLVARGAEAFVRLYPTQPASDPGNRLLAAPETARALRRAISDPSHPHVAALRSGHLLPPLDHPASQTPQAVCTWRRCELNEVEARFLEQLELSIYDADNGIAFSLEKHEREATAAAKTLGPNPDRDALVAWFLEFYEDPVNGVPYNTREGGYQYIYGGPWDAASELAAMFPDAAAEEIDAAADELLGYGADWIKVGLY